VVLEGEVHKIDAAAEVCQDEQEKELYTVVVQEQVLESQLGEMLLDEKLADILLVVVAVGHNFGVQEWLFPHVAQDEGEEAWSDEEFHVSDPLVEEEEDAAGLELHLAEHLLAEEDQWDVQLGQGLGHREGSSGVG
jgi:hypothetical protein